MGQSKDATVPGLPDKVFSPSTSKKKNGLTEALGYRSDVLLLFLQEVRIICTFLEQVTCIWKIIQ